MKLILAALAIAGLLMLSTSVKAATLPCMTKAQAIETGKHARYRQITPSVRCWYVTTRTPAKTEFAVNAGRAPEPSTSAAIHGARALASRRGEPAPVNPRATGVATRPARQSDTEQQRVQAASFGSIPDVGASYQAMVEDAFLALTGRPESDFTFDAYWNRMTGWAQ